MSESNETKPGDVSTDQLIELTAHLERVRARAIVEDVQKIGTDADPATVNSHFCGWASALEEVAYRLKTEAWGMLPNGGWGPTGAANEDDRPSPEFPELLRRALSAPSTETSGDRAPSEQGLVITLCGSARFERLFKSWNEALTMAGHTVFTLTVFPSDKAGVKQWYSDEQKLALDAAHFRKIEASDAIFVLNRHGYIGESTMNEIEHARKLDKAVYFLESWGQGLGIGHGHTDEAKRAAMADGLAVPTASPIDTFVKNKQSKCPWSGNLLGRAGSLRSAIVELTRDVPAATPQLVERKAQPVSDNGAVACRPMSRQESKAMDSALRSSVKVVSAASQAHGKSEAVAYPEKAIPKWLADIIGKYGVAGGREPNMESAGMWQTLIKGIQRHVREQIDADRAQRPAAPAADAAVVAEGWKLVPVNPTIAMMAAGAAVCGPSNRRTIFRAMVEAAPSNPSQSGVIPPNCERQSTGDSVRVESNAKDAGRTQHDADSKELRSLCQARDEARRERDLARVDAAGMEASVGHLSRLVDQLRPGHDRYEYLRERPVNAVALRDGGVFAGMVPKNVVLNGDDLDAAIDAALAQQAAPAAGSQS